MAAVDTRRWLRAAAGAIALVGLVALGLRVRRMLMARRREPDLFVEGPLPPVAPPRERTGLREDRGHVKAYGLDLERLRGQAELRSVVQYLTYVQSRRGDRSHLLFVRFDDLDAMATLEGQPVQEFLERLDQLGVVVSNN